MEKFLFLEGLENGGGDVIAQVLPVAGSDHWPVCLVWEGTGLPIQRPCHFEQLWIEQKELKSLVHQWWEDLDTPSKSLMYQFQWKLKALKERLHTWNKHKYINIFQHKKHLM